MFRMGNLLGVEDPGRFMKYDHLMEKDAKNCL